MRKKWYKSKTLWFNVLVAMGAAIEASLSLVEGYFNPATFLTLISIVAGVNVVLRFISTNGLEK